jgi:hypothetical protein
MSPEQQRAAIAKARGFTFITVTRNGPRIHLTGCLPNVKGPVEIPDYLSDLNAAMQAARHFKEHVLDTDGWERFGRLVEDSHHSEDLILRNDEGVIGTDRHGFATLLVETSAATICECLLKAGNLWTP